ncbi:hypothetical protein D915_006125 [Fasciola hepatica]|uniref:Uncharacterized protein n=1 Tax=Fasciola hepatica TaxID=6192 RepID=A0A4E0R488_FASHE|nr:hypothetical protein D915_006125 [Fasciola hepatica]
MFFSYLQGAIEIAESPVDKFQILINVTNGLSSNQKINYLLRNTDDAVYVELYSRVAELTVKSTGEEEKIYLQLLFVTVSALILVVFVVSIIFSCWWLKSQKWEDETQLTDAVYYITLPPEVNSLFFIRVRNMCSLA